MLPYSPNSLELPLPTSLLIASDDPAAISELIQSLNNISALKDLGAVNYFLGIQVS